MSFIDALEEAELLDEAIGTDETHVFGGGRRLGRHKTASAAELNVAGFRNGPGNGDAKDIFKAQVEDLIHSPSHYNTGATECIDAIRQALGQEGFVAFCHGNALKYLWRAKFKDAYQQDLAKAAWYLRMATGDDPRKVVKC